MSPTTGWKNYDNSPSLKLARLYPLAVILRKAGLVNAAQWDLVSFARKQSILWADATRTLPEADNSVEVIYSSHMFEHLDPPGATRFLAECRRVLKPGGVIRLAVPDIAIHVRDYLAHQDADEFVRTAYMCVDNPSTFAERLKLLLVGNRHHQWMYDGKSLARRLEASGFVDVVVQPPGTTVIADAGDLDLREREDQSVYVEARKAHGTSGFP